MSTIAYNAGADFLRSLSIDGQRPVHFANSDRWLHLVDDRAGGDDGESSSGSELAELVAHALAELPVRQREVLSSDYWTAGVSDSELAAKFSVAESMIRNDRMRAKRKLREILIRLGFEEFLKVRRNSVYLDRETNSSPSAPPDSSDFRTGNRGKSGRHERRGAKRKRFQSFGDICETLVGCYGWSPRRRSARSRRSSGGSPRRTPRKRTTTCWAASSARSMR